ncbi:MAG: aconitase X [Acidimicrobiia bacterium]
MARIDLTDRDRAFLAGDMGEGAKLAMTIIIRVAEAMGARKLLDITRAHIDSCVFYGVAGLDFAERMRDAGAHTSVPTTLNISSLDLLHPDLYRGDEETKKLATRLMNAYVDMGGQPTWTCAPYQLTDRPGFGEQIAWAESNAIVFANSVIGARTNPYGDFIDIAAAVTGRVPAAGLHLSENRRGELLFRLRGLPEALLREEVFFPVLGHLIGRRAGRRIPVISELPASTSEDSLKALGAAAASSGSVALFHAVGLTPEAPDTGTAFAELEPLGTIDVDSAMIAEARDELTTATTGPLRAVTLGTPHMSIEGFARLAALLSGEVIHPEIEFYINTGRSVLDEVRNRGWLAEIERAGAQVVTDTCTYVTPILRRLDGVVMTDSGKWAYYAPGNLGVDVAFGSMKECVRSGVAGRIVRDEELWSGI